ncbi:MAG: T9SS type A sorting domain-containing protein [Candidatus Marinimicrobia bacterium]|nr:T9SS type A sorting domain-containing protein [Candidatus Neomarinimicrobiota bacterium]
MNPEPYFVYQTDNLSVSFTDSSLMPLTWWWDFGDGVFSNLQHPIHVFPGNGTYYVCETVTNECNTETYCDSVTVQSTWVDENRQSTWFTLYPNPAVDHIKISLNVTGTKEVSIKILNSYGLKKNEISLTAVSDKTMISIPLDGYEKGLYLICLQIDRITETRKFIVL